MSKGSTELPTRMAARQSAKSKKKKKPQKKRSVFKTLFIIFFSILLIIAAVLAYLVFKADKAVDQISEVEDSEVVIPVGESVKEKSVAVLLLGLDARANGGGLNTDVMMVAAFNPTTKSTTIVTIPRDSRIDIKGYSARKANSFYADFYMNALNKKKLPKEKAFADAKEEVRTVMSELFNIDIKYSAVINFQGFADVVDALGGVKVDVDMRMKYKDNADGTNIDLEKGIQTLNGDKALDFVRYRKSNDGRNMSSDFDRNKRQSQVISALTDKMKSFSGATKIGDVIDSVGKNLTIDMPPKEIKNMLTTYFGISNSDITFIPLEGDWRSPYVYLNDASLNAARTALQAKMAE
ncbi:LCP family protein required for cell wall assembly [Paenibacillus castaneae]|uniref:LCP family protein n=1 Tax=Paenibacillus castaneae TaxID=474957 RepID=UPI000C99B751|nr:LCP family protein [Paenibacillus castaneae]NIK75890.1 LCP family protein required for cell wall assembly [Paenibacillus castaneae]